MVTVAMKLKDALLLGRKVMTNLDSILKSRDIIFWSKELFHLPFTIFQEMGIL